LDQGQLRPVAGNITTGLAEISDGLLLSVCFRAVCSLCSFVRPDRYGYQNISWMVWTIAM